MIARLRGPVVEKTAGAVVVDAGGVGYEVAVGSGTAARLPDLGEEVRLFVVESVAMYGGGTSLYGFLTEGEKRLFNAFRDLVPGTGAKKALELLDKAAASLADFYRAVDDKNAGALVSGFGFTAKTADKLVAALHGKLDAAPAAGSPVRGSSALEEAVAGLIALGYREPAARAAAQTAQLGGAGGAAQDLIRESLRHLSGRN
ncbi:MAG TPA: OB-fold domain-containing protein [Elusimicrobiota bacterium]|nr:OB-fold domain-containing protein [Elusimicrobiota bacterium]